MFVCFTTRFPHESIYVTDQNSQERVNEGVLKLCRPVFGQHSVTEAYCKAFEVGAASQDLRATTTCSQCLQSRSKVTSVSQDDKEFPLVTAFIISFDVDDVERIVWMR